MKIYNTLTRKKEEFVPINKGKVMMYVCGPTTYNYIHIGNARPICVFDTLCRYLEYIGYQVNHVQNYTDIDDKIIAKANEEGIDAVSLAQKYIDEYNVDARGLNVREATTHPKVSENIPEIIKLVEELEQKGFAYAVDGDVYFRTNRFDEYGKLSHMPLDDLEAGARIDVNSTKENPMDFALWKSAKPNEPSWDTAWGKGRPGWHIECSAMAKKYLADTIDIHCGGQDLIFPHHENEIAQSECANGCSFAHYWMHNGYININNQKMSKSLGNFFTTREVAQKYGYEPIRLLMLQAHYRSQINYTVEVIEACKASLERLANCKDALKRAIENCTGTDEGKALLDAVEMYKSQFITAMDDDLNTADALTAVYELVREINTALASTTPCKKEALQKASNVFDELLGVLGLLQKNQDEQVPQEVLDLVEERKLARQNKDFALADTIRDKITELGYVVLETRQGIKITKQ